MNCIDLKTIAGKRYRIDYDPAYSAEHGERGRADDPWLLVIPCRYGHVYPHSANRLGVATNGRHIGLRIARLSGVEIWQDADDGMNLLFPAELFKQVAAIVSPRRRRQLTPEQQAIAADRLAKYRREAQAQSDLAA